MILSLEKLYPAPQSIDEILADEDDLGLLANVQPAGTKAPTARGNDTKVNNFLEIVDFVRASGREPDVSDLAERLAVIHRIEPADRSFHRANRHVDRKSVV